MLLVEIISGGNLPFPAEPRDPPAQPSSIVFRPPALEPPRAFSKPARALCVQLLQKQAFLRPTAEEALASSYAQRTGDDAGEDESAARLVIEHLAREREAAGELEPGRTGGDSCCAPASGQMESLSLQSPAASSAGRTSSGSSAFSWASSLVDGREWRD